MKSKRKQTTGDQSNGRPYESRALRRSIVHAVLHGTFPMRWGVILVMVLIAVGSLPFLLGSYQQESQIGNISMRPGWQTIISYRGVGSATITGQHITLPQVWGEGLWCRGDAVHIAISGVKTKMALGNSSCSASQSPVSPQSISLDLQPENIQVVTVTTAPSTTWRLDFLQESKATAVQIGSGWSEAISIGGVGNPASAILGGIGTTPEKLWGIMGVCIGDTGASISAQFTPTPGKLSSLACDGMPHLSIMHYASPTAVQEMHVTPASGKHVVFSTALVACANESQCESNQPPIYSTPTSVLNAYCSALKAENAQVLYVLQPDTPQKLSVQQIKNSFWLADHIGSELASCTISHMQEYGSTAMAVVSIAYKSGAKGSATFLLKKNNGSWKFVTRNPAP